MYTLAHLHVICRDMEKMIRFWREALGAEFVEYRTFGDDPGAIMRFGGLEIYFKEIPQAKELQSGQVGYEHVGVYVPHLETSVESLVKGFGCTLASMPANQNRVAFESAIDVYKITMHFLLVPLGSPTRETLERI